MAALVFTVLYAALPVNDPQPALTTALVFGFDAPSPRSVGEGWNIVESGISIAFVLYILTYAYISTSGNSASYAAEMSLNVPARAAGF